MTTGELPAVIEAWHRDTDKLVEIVREFDPTSWDRPSANEGWTNRQVLAHLATGYGVRVAALRARLDGSEPPEIDPDATNAENVSAWASAPADMIIAEMIRARRQILTLMHALRPEHLDAPTNLRGGMRLGDALLDFSRHDLDHASELRR